MDNTMKSRLGSFWISLFFGKDPFMNFRITYLLVAILIMLQIWACSPINETSAEEEDTVQISINLVSQSSGQTTNTINTSNPGLIRIRVRNGAGDAIADQLVTVSATKGTLSPEDGTAITGSDGLATVSLQAGSDSGAGEITATASTESDSLAFQIGAIADSSTSDVGAIEFVSADPNYIALKSTGGTDRKETSIVSFRVVDDDGLPSPDQTVAFSLSTEKGGLTLSAESATSDSSGLVQVVVSAGTIPTPVSVLAEVEAFDVSTISSELIVSTGLPDQDSFSLSVSSHNPEAWGYDGVEVTATIHAADHFNNPIPDGTTVYFRTEQGGGIEPSCSTTDGACYVTWVSGGTRTLDGLVTIMAYVLGEESFTDVNANGIFDLGDSLNDDLPEAWLDIDYDGFFDSGVEEFVDFDVNGSYDTANSKYNGTLCSDLTLCTTDLVDVRDHAQIVMSTSGANITITPSSISVAGEALQLVSITVEDLNGNSMPGGTTIKAETTNGTIEGTSSWTIPDTIYPATYQTYIKGDDNSANSTSGILTITVTSPKGLITTATAIVND
jgi:hypothetical protein